jgi:hypothetical protein
MYSYPTLHEVRSAADYYWQVWQQLLSEADGLHQVLGQHSPTALGWKVEGDLAPLEAAARLFELGDSLFAGPVSERTILVLRKQRAVALDTLQEIKLMQRRPTKPDDALGPDSLDLLLPHGAPKLEKVKKAVAKLDVYLEEQSNEAHEWVSLVYMGREFKLQNHPVWEVCVREAADLIDITWPEPGKKD